MACISARPASRRSSWTCSSGLRVDTNIEAGIKYISQMVRRFRREDYAVAAYNAGPGQARPRN